VTTAINNAWLGQMIENAKKSALPILVRNIFVPPDTDDVDGAVSDIVDAIELALLALTGEITTQRMQEALKNFAEMYTESIGAPWEVLADAILGTLEWDPPDPKKWTLNTWDRR
jgi:hypothetical protein